MIFVQLIQWVLATAAGIIGLGILGLIAESVAHSRACRQHALLMAQQRQSLNEAVPVLTDVDQEPEDLTERFGQVRELEPVEELAGQVVAVTQGIGGQAAQLMDAHGVATSVWFPQWLLRTPLAGENVTVMGAGRPDGVFCANGWRADEGVAEGA